MTCESLADGEPFGGKRCGKPASFIVLGSRKCSECTEVFRKLARSPLMMMNVIAGRPRTDEEIDRMIRPIQ